MAPLSDLDPFASAIVDALGVADRLSLRVLLVGALARELCLPPPVRVTTRRTRDADLAIQLDDWSALTAFFAACEGDFQPERDDLFLRHRATGAKLDVVPCGGLERPPGTIRIPRSSRDLNTHGLREAFDRATPLRVRDRTLLVPTPAAFVLLKCLSFRDRRAPHDLRDAGSVLQRFTVAPDAVWADEAVIDGFARGALGWEDMNAWMLGRAVATEFSETTRAVFGGAIEALLAEGPATRKLLGGEHGTMDEQVERATRQLDVLRQALTAPCRP